MFVYTISVISDVENTKTEFSIQSQKQLDGRLLQIIGLYLDDGMNPELLKEEYPTAASFVEVLGPTVNKKYIDEILS